MSIIELCDEAIAHCRWKGALMTVLESNIVLEKYSNKNFEEIFESIYNICKEVKGIGLLTMYDIVSAICRRFNVNIEHVYIIGGGPIRACGLLHLEPKRQKICKGVVLRYLEIKEIVTAYQENGYTMDNYLRTNTNGDDVESYICNWQKNI
jgi:hypothetical protein